MIGSVSRADVAVLMVCGAIAMAGCGGSAELSGQSSCRDYAQASPEDRARVVDTLAQDLGAPDAAGLGQGNVSNACIRDPDAKLCAVVSRYAPRNTENGVITSEDDC